MFSAPKGHKATRSNNRRNSVRNIYLSADGALLEPQLQKEFEHPNLIWDRRALTWHTEKTIVINAFFIAEKKLCPQLHEWLDDMMRKTVDCRQFLFFPSFMLSSAEWHLVWVD